MKMRIKDRLTFAAWGGALLLCLSNVAHAAEGPYGGTAAAIPGTVLAENYDTGGQGVAYDVTTVNGTDNSYRSDGVDLETATPPATGNDLGWTASGQWFKYTVNAATAGTYTVSFLVAAPSAVTDGFHLSNSSGTNLSGPVNVPATGGWQTWTTVTATVTLPAGTQTLTLNQDNAGWNIDTAAFALAEGPYGGTAAAIPGTVLAENYDTGGQGVAYNVTSTNGTDNGYRSQGVDLETATSPATGNDLGWTAAGQWFRYTVKVSTAGTYTVSFLVAAESAITDAFHLSSSSGTNLSGSVAVPDTSGWQVWTTVTATVTLPAGTQTLTLNQDSAGWNIDSLVFAAETSSCVAAPSAPTGLAASGTTGSGTTLSWTADTAPANCSISSYTVFENGSEIGTATGTSFAVTGLSASTTYSFTVEANDSVGPSPASSALSVTTSSSSGGEGPYGGTPVAIPGTVLAENYDLGGLGVGYEVSSTNGTDNAYRSDGVDLETASAPATGNDLGWTASGQWFRYTVNVSTAGTYTVNFLVAAESAISDAFHLSNSSGINLSGSVAVPDTGGWQTWTTVTATVTLPAGTQTLTLDQDNGGWNIDSMAFASGNGGGGGGGGKLFAPYIDMSITADEDIVTIQQQSGVKAFTLAFLDAVGACDIGWGGLGGTLPTDTLADGTSILTLVQQLQSAGVTVIYSIGGADGVDPAAYCSSASSLQAVYQTAVTRYGIKYLDFDIEGAATAEPAQITLRDQALVGLKAANPNLVISYTIPVEPTGLVAGDGLNLLSSARSDGVSLSVVNVMTMDYGSSGIEMGSAATEAAAATETQIQQAGLSATVGITPMIGQNDSSGEIFTLADATTLLNFANSNSYVTRLAMWSMGRDNGSCAGEAFASPSCSGVSQSTYEFSEIFETF
jgi:hypothetical protein